MPWRTENGRAVMQFITFAKMPSMVYKAAVKKDLVSNTQYMQHAICEALSRDLEIPLEELLAQLPPARNPTNRAWVQARRTGSANTVEEVR